MDDQSLKAIAAEALLLARGLAPLQNVDRVRMPAGPALAAWRRFWRAARALAGLSAAPELRGRDVVRVTNALLNAGNALDFLTRDNTKERPCPTFEPNPTSATPSS